MADLRRLLEMTQGNGKPNALIEAYLQMTQQEAGEQELGGPRHPPTSRPRMARTVTDLSRLNLSR